MRFNRAGERIMHSLTFRKAPRDTLTDHVIGEIRRMVLSGTICPGEMLPTQPQLAQQLGVGVATIRRAVAALCAVGVLDSQPGRGTTVNPDGLTLLQASALLNGNLDPKQTTMIYEARRAIETHLAVLAAQRATPEQVDDIREALEEMAQSMEDEEAFTSADLKFHLAVARAGGNELLAQFYHVSRKLLSDTIEQLVSLPGMKEGQLKLQRQVFEAISKRNAAAARRATRAQLTHVEKLMQLAGMIE